MIEQRKALRARVLGMAIGVLIFGVIVAWNWIRR